MPLAKQNVTIPLGGALDESKDDKLMDRASIPAATNAQYEKHGRVSKAPGYTAKAYNMVDSRYLKDAFLLKEFRNKFLAGALVDSGNNRSAYHEYFQLSGWESNEGYWRQNGHLVPMTQTTRQLIYSSDAIRDPDIAYMNGYEWIVWEENIISSSSIWLQVIDSATGVQVIRQQIALGNGGAQQPRIIALDDYLHVWLTDNINNIQLVILEAADPTNIGSATIKISDHWGSGRVYDACQIEDSPNGNCSAVAYKNTTGSGELTIKVFDEGCTVRRSYSSGNVFEPEGAIAVQAITIPAAKGALAVAAKNGTDNDLDYMIFEDSTMAAFYVTKTQIASFTDVTLEQLTISEELRADTTNGAIRLWAQVYMGEEARPYRAVRTWKAYADNGTGPIGSEDTTWYHYGILSRAYTYEERSHCVLHYDSSTEPRAVIACPGALNSGVCETLTEGIGLLGRSRIRSRQCLPTVIDDNDNFSWVAIKEEFGDARSLVRRNHDYTPKAINTASIDDSLQIGSGLQHIYSGDCADSGFVHSPFIHDTDVTADTGSLGVGDYSWLVTYEWTDSNGNWHVSKVSNAVAHTALAKDQMDLTIWCLQAGTVEKLEGVKICVYRTLVDGSTYYFVGDTDNDPTAESKVFSDTYLDDDIDDNRTLYTTSGELENGTPPPGIAIAAHDDRIWTVNEDDPCQLFYSKPKETEVAVSFNSLQVVRCPEPIIGLASLGDYLLAFSERKIYGITGAGPDKLGNGAFRTPRILSNDVGCSNRASILTTDLGVVFQAPRGIHLMAPGSAPKLFSQPVEDSLAGHTVVKTMALEEAQQIRFLLDSEEILVFDYAHGRWSVWTGYSKIILTGEYNGVVYYLDSNNNYYYENGSFRHLSTAYSTTLETPWIRLEALTGFQRVWWVNILGTWKASHTMRVKLYYDYDDSTIKQTVDFACTASITPYTLRIKPQYQKCQAIKIKLEDRDHVTPYSSAELHAVELTIGAKGGYNRRPNKKG